MISQCYKIIDPFDCHVHSFHRILSRYKRTKRCWRENFRRSPWWVRSCITCLQIYIFRRCNGTNVTQWQIILKQIELYWTVFSHRKSTTGERTFLLTMRQLSCSVLIQKVIAVFAILCICKSPVIRKIGKLSRYNEPFSYCIFKNIKKLKEMKLIKKKKKKNT